MWFPAIGVYFPHSHQLTISQKIKLHIDVIDFSVLREASMEFEYSFTFMSAFWEKNN